MSYPGIRGRTLVHASMLFVFCLFTAGARAATVSTTFDVTATVVDACSVSATDLDFGSYDPSSGTALDGSSTISANCTVGTGYTLSLDIGGGGGAYTQRLMDSAGTDTLGFNLFTDAARTQVWGDGSGATATVSSTGAGLLTSNNHTVYGRIPISQDVEPESYSSTITVTVTY